MDNVQDIRSSTHTRTRTPQTLQFFCAMCSTFTLNFMLSGVRSQWGDFSFPGLVSFGTFQSV